MSLRRSVLALGGLSVFGPLSMDMYMPSLPELATDLDTSDTLAQATMSACMIGLGLGQLLVGPLSDRVGRRRPLIASVAVFTVLSVLCALAPTVEILLVVRLVQGLAGAAGMVIAMAMARDMYNGSELSRMLSLLSLVSMSAPILAPIIGGQLARFMDWRGIFVVIAGFGLALFLVALLFVRETLHPAARTTGGAGVVASRFRMLVRDRLFLTLILAGAFSSTAFFAYLSMATFVFQNEFGVSPAVFSVIFAANAVAMLAGTQLNGILVRRVTPRFMYVCATAGAAVASLLLVLTASAGWGLLAFAGAVALYMFADGPTHPNSTTIALHDHGARAGTAASVLGTMSFVVGPVVVPILSLGGATASIMATAICVCMCACALIVWFVIRPMLLRRGR